MSRPQKSEAAANADDEESFSSERKSLGYYYYAGTCGLCLRLFRIKSYLILFTTQQPGLGGRDAACGVDAGKW